MITDNIDIVSLGSGSSGNMTFIRVGDTRIAIDAGISCRAIERGLGTIGENPDDLSGIFITHEHSDHIKGLPVFTKKHRIPIHAAGATADFVACAEGLLTPHSPLYTVEVGEVTVTSFVTPHDSICSVGYIIEKNDDTADKPLRIGFATDLGHISGETEELLKTCRYVVLESNHDPKMLRNGSYPAYLKDRIASRSGHLSNRDCAQCVARLAEAGVKGILLAHLSEENNRPELAMIESSDALDRVGMHGSVTLRVAARNEVTRL